MKSKLLSKARSAFYYAVFCLIFCISVSACSVTTPIASFIPDEPIVTGSVPFSPAVFVDRLSAEDWRRAKAALAVALDPQSTAVPVKWDNPETKTKGSFAPAGSFVMHHDFVCRPFQAVLNIRGAESRHSGFACRQGPNDWMIEQPILDANKKQVRPGALF